MSGHHQVVIVGGGTAGLTVAARLRNLDNPPEVALVEPSDKHYYQPLWTLVGAGEFPREESQRDEADFIPEGVTWLRDAVESFAPEANRVRLRGGQEVSYDFLVVAAGLQLNWHKVKGLPEALGRDGVCSNYAYQYVEKTWENVRNFNGGTALFTHPSGAVKCGGAPQKICYLAEDNFRRRGIRDRCLVMFAAATPNIFAVPRYARTLEQAIRRKGIETRFCHELVEVRGPSRQAVFRRLDGGEEVVIPYEMLHVTPPMGPPDFIAQSPLADAEGWAEVDRHTLRHVRFGNVFALGDCSSLPTSKTGAAVRKQAPVLVENLAAALEGRPLPARYDGYTSCPLVTGYGRMVLAEFDYDKNPTESFPFDQAQERYSMYAFKKYALPALYWHGMLKGRL